MGCGSSSTRAVSIESLEDSVGEDMIDFEVIVLIKRFVFNFNFPKMFQYLSYLSSLRDNSVPEKMPNIFSQLNGNRFDTLVEVTEEEDNLVDEENKHGKESLDREYNLKGKELCIDDDISDTSDDEVVITEIK